MKVSLNWVRQFADIDISVEDLVTKIGAQLGQVEAVTDLGKKYQGVIIAKVVICEKHPNADKLSVCWIDDGGAVTDVERNEQGLVQVVCGAPNVKAGLLVAWLPPGSTVPNSVDKDPFVLGARELRGVVSNGMLASASELAISDDHNGIVEVDIDAAPGSLFAEVYQLNDYIIDIENKMFTHRPDCFGILGVAREIAGISHKQFVSPDWYVQALDRIKPGHTKLPLVIQNNVPELVPRIMAISMADVTIGPSSLIMQTYLNRVGLRPINNVVDITNYLMVLTGQPTHAYDLDKLPTAGLETRMSRAGDTIRLLNGKTIELKDDASILITSNDVPVGLAGVMGGADTEVSESTKNIVIECANFNMYSIRRTSMKYGLFTDAVTRFNKGQSPLQNERILEESVAMLQNVSGGHVASDVYDIHPNLAAQVTVRVEASFINDRLGSDLSAGDIATLLRNVEFDVNTDGHVVIATAPFWRTDIEIAEDIVEEVGRLYGYDRLPLQLPLRDLTPVVPNKQLSIKTQLRAILSSAGANEVLTYGFVHSNLFEKTGQNKDLAFKLGNALSPELQYFRLSLTPSLLEKVHPNIKSGFNEFALFEIGKTHGKSEIDEDGLPKEFDRLSLVAAMDEKTAKSKTVGAPYFWVKQYVTAVFGAEAEDLAYKPLDEFDSSGHAMFEQLLAPFEPKRSAVILLGKKLAGVVGEYRSTVKRAFKLPDYCAGFELFLSPFVSSEAPISPYKVISRFPKVEQDITLRVSASLPFADVARYVTEHLDVPQNTTFEFQPIGIFKKAAADERKNITLRLVISSHDRTLTAQEVNTMLDSVAASASEQLQAERI